MFLPISLLSAVSSLSHPHLVLQPFTSCCIGSAGHRTTTTTTSPNLPTSLTSCPSPEFAFPAHGPSLIRSQSFPATFAGGRWGSLPESSVHTIPAGLQDTEWGSPTSLDGLLGTAFICHEALQLTQARTLHAAGQLRSVQSFYLIQNSPNSHMLMKSVVKKVTVPQQ